MNINSALERLEYADRPWPCTLHRDIDIVNIHIMYIYPDRVIAKEAECSKVTTVPHCILTTNLMARRIVTKFFHQLQANS